LLSLTLRGRSMRRREFIVVFGGAAVARSPLVALAQEKGRIYRIGHLSTGPRNVPPYVAFYEELQRQGFVEKQNLVVDEHGFGLHPDQFPEHASELARTQVDVIMCAGEPAIRIVQQATKSIPIVANGADLVGSGVVRSLAKPGGNVTGISFLASQLDGKRQEILMQAIPGARRMAALADVTMSPPQHLQMLQELARTHGVELSIHRVAKLEEVPDAIEAAKSSGAEALNVLASPLLNINRRIILERVAPLRLPTVYEWAEVGEEGSLLAYGPRLVQIYRDVMARLVVKVLRGAKPEELPIEQPTKFELVINLKTAKALGLTIPDPLLARADEVIE
jgi:putative tryptophan/tyrosine transport system substrate-binding protein